MPLLSVNIDHVATVRQARYRDAGPDVGEPDPVRAAHEAELGGADGITVHLREDRRHIGDRDVELLRRLVRVRFNLEMAATEEMTGIAERVRPHVAMLVPEGRDEVTTEGGLDVAGGLGRISKVVERLHGAGVLVSAFIDADARQIEAAAKARFDVCEIHTGPYAHAFTETGGDFRRSELREALRAVRDAAVMVVDGGMRCNAGHALNYANVGAISRVIHAANAARASLEPTAGGAAAASAERGELHIGHAIVSRAVFTGLRGAVAEMKGAIREALALSAGAGSLGGAGAEIDAIIRGGPAGPARDGPTGGGTRLA